MQVGGMGLLVIWNHVTRTRNAAAVAVMVMNSDDPMLIGLFAIIFHHALGCREHNQQLIISYIFSKMDSAGTFSFHENYCYILLKEHVLSFDICYNQNYRLIKYHCSNAKRLGSPVLLAASDSRRVRRPQMATNMVNAHEIWRKQYGENYLPKLMSSHFT